MTITLLIVRDILSLNELRQLISLKKGSRIEWEAVYSFDSVIVIDRKDKVLMKSKCLNKDDEFLHFSLI